MSVTDCAFADLTSYDPLYATGRNCRFLQGPKADPSAPRRIRSCLDAGQGRIEWIVNYRYDGTAFWNLLFISPVHAEDGPLLFFFGNQLHHGTSGLDEMVKKVCAYAIMPDCEVNKPLWQSPFAPSSKKPNHSLEAPVKLHVKRSQSHAAFARFPGASSSRTRLRKTEPSATSISASLLVETSPPVASPKSKRYFVGPPS